MTKKFFRILFLLNLILGCFSGLGQENDSMLRYVPDEIKGVIDIGNQLHLFYGLSGIEADWMRIVGDKIIIYEKKTGTFTLLRKEDKVDIDEFSLNKVKGIRTDKGAWIDADNFYFNSSKGEPYVCLINDSTISTGIIKVRKNHYQLILGIRNNKFSPYFEEYNEDSLYANSEMLSHITLMKGVSHFIFITKLNAQGKAFYFYEMPPFIYNKTTITAFQKKNINKKYPTIDNSCPTIYIKDNLSKNQGLEYFYRFKPYTKDESNGNNQFFVGGSSLAPFIINDTILSVFSPDNNEVGLFKSSGQFIANLSLNNLRDSKSSKAYITHVKHDTESNSFWLIYKSDDTLRTINQIRFDSTFNSYTIIGNWKFIVPPSFFISEIDKGNLYISASAPLNDEIYIYELPFAGYKNHPVFRINPNSRITFNNYYERINKKLKEEIDLPEDVINNNPYEFFNPAVTTYNRKKYPQNNVSNLISSIYKSINEDNYQYLIENLVCFDSSLATQIQIMGIDSFCKAAFLQGNRFQTGIEQLESNKPFLKITPLKKGFYSVRINSLYEFFVLERKNKYYLSAFFWSVYNL